ncbi:CaiB/BaiF CoA-transferase family protein [Actinomadura vinacea]|uniref:CaiB/BaiF CoA-transferase family protein n=1 Tax=Actinomadura vinacea TaxID=115336 RepID=A0ABN3KDN6_9ACTN
MDAYAGLRVIEVSGDPGGEYTGKLLADMGADVVKVEPPGGSPTRRTGPFAGDVEGPENSLTFWFYNGGKRSVVLDWTGEDRAAFEDLVAGADVLLIGLRPSEAAAAGLDYDLLLEAHPRLVVLSVTPFGLTGPWADYRSSDLVALAAGGPLMSCGYDDHSIPPIRPGGNQGYHTAASFAHTGLLMALLERRLSGLGQLVDVSMHESLAVTVELANPYWFYPRVLVQRQTCRHAQPVNTQPTLFRCGDDRWIYFALILADHKPWNALVEWMDEQGLAADLVAPEYGGLEHRQRNFDHVQEVIECFFLLQDSATVYHEGQRRGLPIGPLYALEDLLEDEHLTERRFFAPVELDEGRSALFPTSPYRFSAAPPSAPGRPPRLGEHTAEVLRAVDDASSSAPVEAGR